MSKKNIKKLIEKGGGNLKATGDFVIPNSVTTIGDMAFRGCYDLHTITIPNSVKSIGESAFSDCYGLTSVTITSSDTKINFGAFGLCKNLTTIIIPRGSREKFEQQLPIELHHKLKEGTIDLSEGDVNYEEKYKEARKRAEILVGKLESAHIKGFIYHIFPELKESEDERIKKEILNLVAIAGNGNQFEEIKGWLERQGKTNADRGD